MVNGTYVSWDICGHITTLCFNNRKSCKRSSAEFIAHLGSALEETRVQVEDITRVSLTTWWTTKQERHLAVSDGLLGKIVINNES
jgi:hypothetical protein